MAFPHTGLTLRGVADINDWLFTDYERTTRVVPGQNILTWQDEGNLSPFSMFVPSRSVDLAPIWQYPGWPNGLGCLEFDGVNDYLECYDDAATVYGTGADLITASSFSVAIVVILRALSPSDLTGPGYYQTGLISEVAGYWGLRYGNDAGVPKLLAQVYDGGDKFVALTAPLNEPIIAMAHFSAGKLSVEWYDATTGHLADITGVGNISTLEYWLMVAHKSPPITVAEYAVWNAALSPTDTEAAVAYLRAAWLGGGAPVADDSIQVIWI